ncbi:MAG: hypothetical protein KDC85_18185 [Saprospiraceae bacterium]|nr:hypothetical protein [Saprospiraceae bacterium]MCB9325864.1 hypothetical protein [Lewinellaceae bacterium]
MQKLLDQNAQIVKTMAAMLDQLAMNTKQWYTPDEALKVLGYSPTPNARRRLKYLRDKNFLTSFGSQSPYTYDAQQVKKVADLIRSGELHVPLRT